MTPEPHPTPARPRCYRFQRHLRITRHSEFERVMRAGRRGTDRVLTMWVLPNDRPHPRLGLVVGRKCGCAVQRNRWKRVLRTAFRLSQYDLPAGFDFVCAPRAGGTADLAACTEALVRLAERLARRFSET
ncbi:MAG TPA: ribonuclease P protein component [Phycisphaerae bacterium]|nr:ribonuclease P protein component [Phycisphaerae bacterium]HQL54477.1 ribonuclease P protein component [Phycisphaerae bacterium]